ncbi:hypothetical protein VaNZ11_012265 [Volvox africanus]|uniref:MYND-type domain-containing protein n=1 Tax=Volvox africanus TaxID=51714 RepID=A0ABQ5SDH6_9CHLO|nr:hypothetical protein VaNZ11_012265 [Volvox africanus]
MPSRGTFRRSAANARAKAPETQQPPLWEHLQRIAVGNHSFTPAEVQDMVNTVARLGAVNGNTFLCSANFETVAGVIVLWGLAVRKSGPAAQGVSEEARNCYRKLRAVMFTQVLPFFKLPGYAPGTSKQYLCMDLILDTQVLRCYALLLSELAEAMRDRLNRRLVQAALEVMNEVIGLVCSIHVFICSAGPCMASQPMGASGLYVKPWHDELHASKLFDAWSLCYLHCSKWEDVADQVSLALYRFSAILRDIFPDAWAELYMVSPHLKYLTTLHCVQVLDTLDGMGMYGLPEDANSLPLMAAGGGVYRAYHPGTLSLTLLCVTQDCWSAVLNSSLNILMRAGDDNDDDGDDDKSGFWELRFVVGQKVPPELAVSDRKLWALTQVRLAALADDISPLKARCVFEICIRTVSAFVSSIRRFGSGLELQPSIAIATVRSSLVCACHCLNFLAYLDLRFGDMRVRGSDSGRLAKLWNAFVVAVETTLQDLQQPSLRPDQLWRQRLQHLDQLLHPQRDSCRGGSGAKLHVNPMWYDILMKCPVFMPLLKGPAMEPTWPAPDLLAKTAIDAGLIGLLERLMREKGCFDPLTGSVHWVWLLVMASPDHLTALLVTAAKAMRRVEVGWRQHRSSRGLGAETVKEDCLDDLLAPLEWLSQVLNVGTLCATIDAIQARVGHDLTPGAAAAPGTEGQDEGSGIGAVSSSGRDSSSFGGGGDGSTGHADKVHAWIRNLGLFYSFTAEHILSRAFRLFRRLVKSLALGLLPPGYVLIPKLFPKYACDFLDWCMLLLATYMRKAEMAELTGENSSTSTVQDVATATTATPMAAAAAAATAAEEAAEWKELLLGGDANLLSVLTICVQALRCTLPAEGTSRLAKSVAKALSMACWAFPKELFQAESKEALQGGDSKNELRARIHSDVLEPLLGPTGFLPDAAFLSALTQGRPDACIGDVFGGSVNGKMHRFQATAVLMEPPSRLRKLLPLRMCCNPFCENLTGKSERFLTRVHCGGRGGCSDATFCSQQCRKEHLRMEPLLECEDRATRTIIRF